MRDIAIDSVSFEQSMMQANDSTRVIITADKDFKSFEEIKHFRHVIGQYVQTLDVAKDKIFNSFRECWFHLYDLLDETPVINLQLCLSYNIFGVACSYTMTIEEEIIVCEDQRYFDTFVETPFYLNFKDKEQTTSL